MNNHHTNLHITIKLHMWTFFIEEGHT